MEDNVPLSRHQLKKKFQSTSIIGIFLMVLVFGFLLSLTLYTYSQLRLSLQRVNRIRFENQVQSVVESFQSRFSAYTAAMHATRGFILASEEVTGDEWLTYVENLDITHTMSEFASVNYGEIIPAEQKQEYEARVRADETLPEKVYQDFTVFPPSAFKDLYPIQLVAPLDGREDLIGFDQGTDLERLEAIVRAVLTGNVEATGVTDLVTTDGAGEVLYLAVYHPEMPLETEAQRQAAVKGIISAQLKIPESFDEFFPNWIPFDELEVEVFGQPETVAPDPENLLFDSNEESVRSLSWENQVPREVIELEVGGRKWSMYIYSDSSTDTSFQAGLSPEIALAAGILFSFLVTGLLGALVLLRVNAYRIAYNLTRELEQSRRSMSLLLSNLPGAAYRHNNEPQMRLTYVSDGIEKLTGYSVDEFLSGRVTPPALIVAEERARIWMIMQQALQQKTRFRFITKIVHRDRIPRWLLVEGQGVWDEAGQLEHIEGYLTDITDRYIIEEKLRERALELENLNQLLVGRELRMVELKEKIKELEKKQNES
jgi:PAS domain S-box-containing protein